MSAADNPNANAAAAAPADSGTRFFKFSFLIGKKTDSEQTEMTDDFKKDCQHYATYDEAAAKLVAHLEACYMPCRDPNQPAKDDSLHKIAQALQEYQKHFDGETQQTLNKFAQNMEQASVAKRTSQKDQRYQLRHLRRFRVDDYPKFCAQKKAFDTARVRMDTAKMEIRQAKTTTQIEKKAVCYQMAVDDFDTQTEGVIKLIDALPRLKLSHNKDIVMLCNRHGHYHRQMANFYKF